MAELSAYETKTIVSGEIKAPTINVEPMQQISRQTFKNTVSNQRDVTIDLSQFLDEEELAKLAPRVTQVTNQAAEPQVQVEVLDDLNTQNQQTVENVAQPTAQQVETQTLEAVPTQQVANQMVTPQVQTIQQ